MERFLLRLVRNKYPTLSINNGGEGNVKEKQMAEMVEMIDIEMDELGMLRRLDEIEWEELRREFKPIVDEEGYHPERDDN